MARMGLKAPVPVPPQRIQPQMVGPERLPEVKACAAPAKKRKPLFDEAHAKRIDAFRVAQEIVTQYPISPGHTEVISIKKTVTRTTVAPKVTVQQGDMIAHAHELAKNQRVLVLNMANPKQPGGGVVGGARAQEEDLCRRSNLYTALPGEAYPLDLNKFLHTTEVTIFAGCAEDDYASIGPNQVGVLSAAAPVCHKGTQGGKYTNEIERKRMVAHVNSLIIATREAQIEEGYDTVVLCAHGCGAFSNPPEEVATIFSEAISRYGSSFL